MGEILSLTAADGHVLAAYRADPEGPAKGRLVIIQEIFGVNQHIREVCDGYAAAGYTAVAPALFDRVRAGVELDYSPEGQKEGQAIRGQLEWDNAVADVEAARGLLAPQGPVGVVGFCWGGSISWLAACRLDFAAAVTYYGGQIIQYVSEKPGCPVLMHFGEQDQMIPMTDVEAIRAAHPDIPVHTYGPAGHGFTCDHRASWHAESAALAKQRTLAFFGEHLS